MSMSGLCATSARRQEGVKQPTKKQLVDYFYQSALGYLQVPVTTEQRPAWRSSSDCLNRVSFDSGSSTENEAKASQEHSFIDQS